MTEQRYLPYRTTLLRRDELATLSHIHFRRAATDTLLIWAQIWSAWFLAYWLAHPVGHVLCALFVGNRYYSLFILGHDGLHRRIHPTHWINDLWTDVLLIGPLGAVVHLNRNNHMQHHRTLNLEEDPDRYKYTSRIHSSPWSFAFSLTGVPYLLRAIKNVYGGNTKKNTHPNTINSHTRRDWVILIGTQATLIGSLSIMFGWWGYIFMWALPIYTLTYCADMCRVFCEHSTENGSDATLLSDRLVMFEPNNLERIFFAPMNMHHHIAHHLWPAIPYYNLPAATQLLKSRMSESLHPMPQLTYRSSFVSYLLAYARKCSKCDAPPT